MDKNPSKVPPAHPILCHYFSGMISGSSVFSSSAVYADGSYSPWNVMLSFSAMESTTPARVPKLRGRISGIKHD